MSAKQEDGDLSIRDGKVYMYDLASDRQMLTNINVATLAGHADRAPGGMSVSSMPLDVVDDTRNPAPASFQVWLPAYDALPCPGDGVLSSDGTVTVRGVKVIGETVRVSFFPGQSGSALTTNGAQMRDPSRWRCIGVATPHGRVMVGDGFAFPDGHRVAVLGVTHHGVVETSHSGGMCPRFDAEQLVLEGTRTRYAPARQGEMYRLRSNGIVVDATIGKFMGADGIIHRMLSNRVPVDEWERIEPEVLPRAPSAATADKPNDLVRTSGIASSVFRAGMDDARWGTDRAGKRYVLEAHSLEVTVAGYTFEVAVCTGDTEQVVESIICSIVRAYDEAAANPKPSACAAGKSDHIDRNAYTHGPGNSLIKKGSGPATEAARSEHSNVLAQAPLVHTHDLIIVPANVASSGTRWEMGLTLADMRHLDDALGRALEVGHAEERVTCGLVRLVLDELLISPTVVCAEGVNISADTKYLRLMRQTIKEAAAKGTATCSPWGKEQTITISRLEVGIDMSKAP